MAAPLQNLGRFLRITGNTSLSLSRSAFVARKNDSNNPNWINVGLAFGCTVAIWALLIKQHNNDIAEHEKWKAERGN